MVADKRDSLALERTRLANERTFLAYIRTALSLVAAGAVLFQFFTGHPAYAVIAWVLAILGGVVLVAGLFRFFRVRARLGRSAE